MNKITFATTNEGKLKEAREILKIEVEPLSLDIKEIQTFDPLECVEKKAEAAFVQAGKPILVEDTCLFFDAWDGLPGVFINYFMKALGIEGLIRLMEGESNRKAKAQTSLCFFDGKRKIIIMGSVEGSIPDEPRGVDGFGWDPIFIPKGHDKTFAELGSKAKNKVSMRKIALEKLRRKLLV